MALLPENATLPQYQHYIHQVCAERGWDKNNHLELFLLLSEEVGELAKAIRHHVDLYQETDNVKRQNFRLEEEFADVLAYLLDLANYFGVDLETAFRAKEALNEQRSWKAKKNDTY